ncbi:MULTISPECIES: mechanosensitive ion channel family protein [Methyloversatilis]|jgi:small-conductance mechanosensitive channel|uniref:mechanosensitive ion channel family protein n=1 Tax=Methyloversatilis TaxID=378210 RepID=UPI000DB5FD22|nr:mechanosensitive ion channel domain-containing protein [Methyloversatilis sp.]MCR6665489.1 mechanosensitive ion channel [Methyloversatilis sp.]PZU54314.1 MAG: mechanosensitive ion channel protein MscS [Thauera sp.]
MTEISFDALMHMLSLNSTRIELAVVAACLALAGLITRLLIRRQRRQAGIETLGATARLGLEGLQRLLFPLVGIALLSIARVVVELLQQPPVLMRLVIAMLVAMGVIRLVVYGLRQVFSPAGWLSTFELLIGLTIWSAWVLHALDILPEVIEWLDSQQVALGKQKLSLWALMQGGAWVLVTLIAAVWLSGSVERKLMRAPLDSNLRIVLARLSKVALMFLALMITLPLVGIDLTALSVFGGALGVGLGFGLQKIMANYVSGFIILLDRSIRIGDLISVGTDRGQVQQITTRYTVLRSPSGVQSIVPNETLISSVVQNEGLSDREVRVAISVQVGYADDVERALVILEECARAHERVLSEPVPRAFLHSFGDSGINLELGLWITDPENGTLGIRSAVQLEILRRFRAEGIEIPFPQREIRVLGDTGNVALCDAKA